MKALNYWWHVATHPRLYGLTVTFHKPSDWEWSYDYFWYDGPHRQLCLGPVGIYIQA